MRYRSGGVASGTNVSTGLRLRTQRSSPRQVKSSLLKILIAHPLLQAARGWFIIRPLEFPGFLVIGRHLAGFGSRSIFGRRFRCGQRSRLLLYCKDAFFSRTLGQAPVQYKEWHNSRPHHSSRALLTQGIQARPAGLFWLEFLSQHAFSAGKVATFRDCPGAAPRASRECDSTLSACGLSRLMPSTRRSDSVDAGRRE
jgi:hypothetical protein